MTKHEQAEEFYSALIQLLLQNNVPFMIGGTYAFSAYTGISRPTKDMDIFSSSEEYPKLLKLCNDQGLQTELYDKSWIAKVRKENFFVDVIFSEANGLRKVDQSWYDNARQGTVLGHMVKLIPVEDMIRSKAFIQFRERFDGADVINLFLRYGKTLKWSLLMERIEPYWEILLGHIINFYFVYPLERDIIPSHVITSLLKRLKHHLKEPVTVEKVTRGLLISTQYEVAVSKWGYKPAR